MKKVKWIALALVLCLGLLGGAYAAWTTPLVVDATVDTGEVDMKFTSIATWGTGPGTYLTHSHGGSGTDTATWTIGNLYPSKGPGEVGVVSLAMFAENQGSIPVKLDSVNLTISSPNSGIWDYLHCEVRARKLDAGAIWDSVLPNSHQTGMLKDLDELLIDAIGDTEFEPLSQVRLGKGDEDGNIEEVEGSILIWLCEDAPNQYQNRTITVEAEMVWKQWNLVP